jgi:hypothetical protein
MGAVVAMMMDSGFRQIGREDDRGERDGGGKKL